MAAKKFPSIKPNTAVLAHLIRPEDASVMALRALSGDIDAQFGDCLVALAQGLIQISDPKSSPLCLCCPQKVTMRNLGVVVLLVPQEETAPNERTAICNCICFDCRRGHNEEALWHVVKQAYEKYAPGFLIVPTKQ